MDNTFVSFIRLKNGLACAKASYGTIVMRNFEVARVVNIKLGFMD